MTKCIKEKLILPACRGRIVEAEFIKKEVSKDVFGSTLTLKS
jgi:hypothetical protein